MSDNNENVLGYLSDEEHSVIASARQRGQQNMLRLGEIVFQMSRLRQQQQQMEKQIAALREKESAAVQEQYKLCEDLEELEQSGRSIIDQVARRLNLDPNIQWVAMADKSIKRVE